MTLKPNFTIGNVDGYTFIKDASGTAVACTHRGLSVSIRRADGLLWNVERDFRLTWEEQAAQAMIDCGFESPWDFTA